MKHLKALIVEDSEDDALILLRHLKRGGYEIEYQRVETAASMEEAIQSYDWQIILSDYSMPKFDGLMALAILRKSGFDVPFIMISGTIGEDTAVQAMLAGADDYFIKGNLNRLIPAIERELKESENRRARRQAEKDLDENKKRLRLALNAAGLGVWEWNLQTDEVYWSPEINEILGGRSFNGKLDGFLSLVHPSDVQKVLNASKEAIANQTNYKSEFRVIKEDGGIQWLSNYGLTEYDESGNPLRLTGTVQDITERKKAETSLRESEENLRAIIQASTQFVWTADADGASEELFEWFSELSGRTITDVSEIIEIIHPDDLEVSKKAWLEAFESKTLFDVVIRFLTKSNEYCFLAVRSVPIFSSDGNFRQWVGTFNDISKRMFAEKALHRNEAQLKLVSDTVPTMIMHIDTQLNALFVNRACQQWFGLTEKEALGKNMKEIFDETTFQMILPEFKRALSNETFTIERSSFLKNGSRYLRFNYVPDIDKKGEVQGFFIFGIDLTENKLAEEELRKSEQRFRSLVNSIAQIVWTADADGKLLTALTAHGKLLEGTSENLMDDWAFRLHPTDKERAIEDFARSIKTKKKYKSEYQMLHEDGTYHYYVSRGTPVYEKDGKIREWVGTLTDITKSKLSEDQLRKSEEELRQAQKLESVGRLAGGIAHDFNNMLTAINGYSDLTLRRLDENDPLRRNIEEIKKAGERSASLTQQLLAFSRRQILQVKVIDINQTISESIVMLQRLIGEDIQIVSKLNSEIDFIKADSGQLSQMLLNLVVNSRDAMPQGGTITIKTDNVYLNEDFINQHGGSKIGHYVMLAVTDNGIGIDEETCQQIFEPFFTTKEVGKGTGLGLSTVYGIVSQLGGYILVNSMVGKGTTFEIYLPAEYESKISPENQTVVNEAQTGLETILLVEDEELVRKLSRQVLETCGYKVIEAKDGFEALEFCKKNGQQIDLLLTDVVMPLMNGRELAESIMQLHSKIKVLFTSGYTEDSIIQHSVRESETNFIQKPFTFDELAHKVRELLDNEK